MTIFCKEDGSWWWADNGDYNQAATPIAREDWEKVKSLIADIFEIPLTERWNPTPLKLYELDVELEVREEVYEQGQLTGPFGKKVAHLVEPKPIPNATGIIPDANRTYNREPKQTMKEKKEELETEDEKASGTKGAIYLHGYYTAKDAIEIFKIESSNEQSITKEMRSVRVDLFSPCEKAILNAQYELEKVGSSEGLTKAAILLSEARQLVTDYLWTTKK